MKWLQRDPENEKSNVDRVAWGESLSKLINPELERRFLNAVKKLFSSRYDLEDIASEAKFWLRGPSRLNHLDASRAPALAYNLARNFQADFLRQENRLEQCHSNCISIFEDEGEEDESLEAKGKLGVVDPIYPADFADIDSALEELRKERPRFARIVELRFLEAKTLQDTAKILGVSKQCIQQQEVVALEILRKKLNESGL